MLGWFKAPEVKNFLKVDVHSHLLPGLDDGVKNMDESLAILKSLKALGFDKIITTPHIISGYYPNNPRNIAESLALLKKALSANDIDLKVEAAAEYYVDEHFLKLVEKKDELATFTGNHILIETGFMTKPVFLKEIISQLLINGYQPILAHPERYVYFQQDYEAVEDLRTTGIKFQLNALSVLGYYSREAKKLATYLISQGMVELIGSDIHNEKQLQAYKTALRHRLFQQCGQLPLLNNAL
ncbi:MAG: capsular biosynthesis protein [Reichenbachiella sp.]